MTRSPSVMAPRSDFGSRLRQARTRKGVSLREIALKTKISVSALEALERNDISRLPGGIFSRAFVRSYAIEVGLDPEQTVEDFIAQFPHDSVTAGTPHSSQADDNEAIESDRRVAETVLKLLVLSGAIAGALIYFASRGRHPSSGNQPTETPTVTAGGPVSRTPATVDADARVPPDSHGAPPPASPAVSSQTSDAQTGAIVVTIRALKTCRLSASADTQRIVGRTVEPGEDLRLSAMSEIVLTADDASALRLTINGELARPLGASGEAITTRITPRNYRSLLQ